MTVNPSAILLPADEPDFRIYENPWPRALAADELNIADYLTRNERHQESMLEPDQSYDGSWRADEKSKWLLKDGEIVARYFVKETKTRAFLATYLDPAVPLAVENADGSVNKYESISLWVNVDGFKGRKFTVRLASDSLTIAIVECDPNAAGQLSVDGKWKRLVLPFANERMTRTIREREYFNKIDLLVRKPAGTSTIEGTIHVKGIQLHVATAADVRKRVVDGY